MNSKPPVPTDGSLPAEARSSGQDIEAFVRKAKVLAAANKPGQSRLILALDATMSRQPTWDLACELQAQMFDAVGKTGGLSVQLAYYRGLGECRSSKFVTNPAALKALMMKIDCRGGQTQIDKVLSHALKETGREKVNALVFIGDAMEEAIDGLADKAGRLGMAGTPVFVFQEGKDASAERAFREIARLSRGAWFRFDRSAADTLAKLLSAVAVFASAGIAALTARNRPEDRLLIEHLTGRAP